MVKYIEYNKIIDINYDHTYIFSMNILISCAAYNDGNIA